MKHVIDLTNIGIEDFLSDVPAGEILKDTTSEIPTETSKGSDTPEGGEIPKEIPKEGSSEETVPKEDVVPPEAVPPGEVPKSEVDLLKEQIAGLTELVNNLSGSKVEVPKVETPKETPPDVNLEEFLKTADFDEIMEKKDKFMSFISNVMSLTAKNTMQQVMQNVPTIVDQQSSMKSVADAFYDSNPELANVKKYVAVVAEGVSSEHQDWTVQQVLDESANRCRVALKIPITPIIPGVPTTPTPKVKPALPGAGSNGGRPAKIEVSNTQKQIDELLQ